MGALTDLGAIFHETREKIFPWHFHGLEHRSVCLMDSYDDLQLPMDRLLAQLLVFASGERFKKYFLASIPSIVVLCMSLYEL